MEKVLYVEKLEIALDEGFYGFLKSVEGLTLSTHFLCSMVLNHFDFFVGI